jgi:8-oxo-dGTP diphosphatase
MDESAIEVVGAAILRRGRCLVTRRGPQQDQAGAWELPGGKVEEGETPAAALARELHEELGIRVEVGRALGRAEARVGRRTIALTVYEARWLDGEIVPREHDRWLWATAADMRNLRWAPADVPLVPRVAERLG